MFSVVKGGDQRRRPRRRRRRRLLSLFPALGNESTQLRFREERFSVPFPGSLIWLRRRIRTARLNEAVVVQPDIKSVSGQLTIRRRCSPRAFPGPALISRATTLPNDASVSLATREKLPTAAILIRSRRSRSNRFRRAVQD